MLEYILYGAIAGLLFFWRYLRRSAYQIDSMTPSEVVAAFRRKNVSESDTWICGLVQDKSSAKYIDLSGATLFSFTLAPMTDFYFVPLHAQGPNNETLKIETTLDRPEGVFKSRSEIEVEFTDSVGNVVARASEIPRSAARSFVVSCNGKSYEVRKGFTTKIGPEAAILAVLASAISKKRYFAISKKHDVRALLVMLALDFFHEIDRSGA
jgi:hypothetical protein